MPVMMNHARVKRIGASQGSGWPRDAQIHDESLNYTFRGDDFLEDGSNWRTKPRVNGCKNFQSMSEERAHRCDLLEMHFLVCTEFGTSERHWAREFVAPYPNEDQVSRLREGPLKDLAQQKQLRRVTFVVHGYMGGGANGLGLWEPRLAKELAEGGFGQDATIVIDWTRGAHATWEDCHGFECLDDYAVAMADARIVGKYIQRLAAGVREVVGDVYLGCIGHSVGSHVCGFASKYMALEDLPGGKLRMSRISGLDPAGPSHSLVVNLHSALGGRSFVDAGYKLARLNKSDADFVDVYISDPGGFGYDITMSVEKEGRKEVLEADMLGHVQFLINGRHYAEHKDFQPGCEKNSFKAGCSHHVAIDLYIDSILHRKESMKKRHVDEHPIRAGWERLIRQNPNLHPHTASHSASIIIMSIFIAIVLICGVVLYMYYRTLLFWLKVTLIVAIIVFSTLAALWLMHRHHKPAQTLLQNTDSVMLHNSQRVSLQDYCDGMDMERMMARCDLPFSTGDGHSGSTCPKFKDEKVTFGICAGPKYPEGLFLAPVEADADD